MSSVINQKLDIDHFSSFLKDVRQDMRIFFVFIFITFSLVIEAKQLKVDVSATGAILINADTGVILFEKEGHRRLYPASTTKVATLLYALERTLDRLDEVAIATADSVRTVHASRRQAPGSGEPSYRLEPEGTNIGLKIGEEMSLRALLYGLILRSGNDAANVIAEHISGSIPRFMEEFNLFLLSLGLKNTHFSNPHGLFHPEHYTTVHDMAKLTQIALKNSSFREVFGTVRYPRPKTNKQEESIFVNTNRLLKPGRNYYAKAIGGKTGYIFHAGHTFIGAAEHEGRTLITVLFQAPKSENNFQDAVKLFEAAFSQEKVIRTLFAKGYDRFTQNIQGARDPLSAVLQEDLVIEYYPAEEPVCNVTIEWNGALSLPIVKGDCVGQLYLVGADQQLIRSVPLFAANTLEKTFFVRAAEVLSSPSLKGAYLFLAIALTLIFVVFRKRVKKSNKIL